MLSVKSLLKRSQSLFQSASIHCHKVILERSNIMLDYIVPNSVLPPLQWGWKSFVKLIPSCAKPSNNIFICFLVAGWKKLLEKVEGRACTMREGGFERRMGPFYPPKLHRLVPQWSAEQRWGTKMHQTIITHNKEKASGEGRVACTMREGGFERRVSPFYPPKLHRLVPQCTIGFAL